MSELLGQDNIWNLYCHAVNDGNPPRLAARGDELKPETRRKLQNLAGMLLKHGALALSTNREKLTSLLQQVYHEIKHPAVLPSVSAPAAGSPRRGGQQQVHSTTNRASPNQPVSSNCEALMVHTARYVMAAHQGERARNGRPVVNCLDAQLGAAIRATERGQRAREGGFSPMAAPQPMDHTAASSSDVAPMGPPRMAVQSTHPITPIPSGAAMQPVVHAWNGPNVSYGQGSMPVQPVGNAWLRSAPHVVRDFNNGDLILCDPSCRPLHGQPVDLIQGIRWLMLGTVIQVTAEQPMPRYCIQLCSDLSYRYFLGNELFAYCPCQEGGPRTNACRGFQRGARVLHLVLPCRQQPCESRKYHRVMIPAPRAPQTSLRSTGPYQSEFNRGLENIQRLMDEHTRGTNGVQNRRELALAPTAAQSGVARGQSVAGTGALPEERTGGAPTDKGTTAANATDSSVGGDNEDSSSSLSERHEPSGPTHATAASADAEAALRSTGPYKKRPRNPVDGDVTNNSDVSYTGPFSSGGSTPAPEPRMQLVCRSAHQPEGWYAVSIELLWTDVPQAGEDPGYRVLYGGTPQLKRPDGRQLNAMFGSVEDLHCFYYPENGPQKVGCPIPVDTLRWLSAARENQNITHAHISQLRVLFKVTSDPRPRLLHLCVTAKRDNVGSGCYYVMGEYTDREVEWMGLDVAALTAQTHWCRCSGSELRLSKT